MMSNQVNHKHFDRNPLSTPLFNMPYFPSLIALLIWGLHLLLAPMGQCFFIDKHQSPHASAWSYGQQHRWPSEYKICSRRNQSPIDIQHKNVITNTQLKIHFYNYNRPIKFKLMNAHHTIKLNPIGRTYQSYEFGQPNQRDRHNFNGSLDSSIRDIISADEPAENPHDGSAAAADQLGTGDGNNGHQANPKLSDNQQPHDDTEVAARRPSSQSRLPFNGAANDIETNGDQNEEDHLAYGGAPAIKLNWLDDGNSEFKLRDIHFHWGETRDNGSEHAIESRRSAMEMHLVHIKHKLDESKIGIISDSLAVISILIGSHKKNSADFNPIANLLPSINRTETPQEIDYKSINDLLPNDLSSFYTYAGSLTTPPCYEKVQWIVMSEPVTMNLKQIEMFRNLYQPNEHNQDSDDLGPQLIVPNIRSLQPLNNRPIMASFPIRGAGRLSAYSGSASSHYHHQNIYRWSILMTMISTLIQLFKSLIEGRLFW